jgi:hypothetical protein
MDNTLAGRRQDKYRYMVHILALHRGSKNQHADIIQYADFDPLKNGPAGRKNHEVGLTGRLTHGRPLTQQKRRRDRGTEGRLFLRKAGSF